MEDVGYRRFEGEQCPRWVKLRRTQCEHMFSALPSNSDIARCSRHVSNVPNPEVAGRWTAPGAPKSEIQFSCVGGLLTYISFTPRNVSECACGWSKVRRRIGAQAPPLPRSAFSRVPLDGTCSSK